MNRDTSARPGDEGGEGHELTCEESLAAVYEYLDGELAPEYHEAVRRHIERCRKCYPYFNFERMFLDYVHEAGAREHPSPELEARVRRLLELEDDAG